MIQVEDCTVAYGHLPILRRVSVRIRQGECVGIIGPNGSGKTTLLKLMSGELRADSGTVLLCGRTIERWTPKERARLVTVVSQEALAPVAFTVYDIVMMGRHPYRRRFRPPLSDDCEVVSSVLRATDLEKLATKSVATLSGGERQRVAIARAMAQEPRILMLDEPTTYLDIGYQLTLLQYVWRWHRETGASVVAVLHDLNLAAQLCERILLVDEGRIVADGTPEHVLQHERIQDVYRTEPHLITHPTLGVPQVLLNIIQSKRDTTSH